VDWVVVLRRAAAWAALAFVGTGVALTAAQGRPVPVVDAAAAATAGVASAPSVPAARTPAPPGATPSPTPTPSATPMPTAAPDPGQSVDGLLTFRGDAHRAWYGTGPIGDAPRIDWSYPDAGGMCGMSTVGEVTEQWCGTGWTGQPAVVERDGRTWVVFGAYDHDVHFVDAATGEDILPPFPTGDIIKGSVTVDPDGYPIVYSGSRDGRYRAIAIDGPVARELWSLTAEDATGPTRWNDDWDGAGLVIDGHLVIGGENSRVFVVRLDRGYAPDGSVEVDAEVLWDQAGWDEELLAGIGDGNVSIEGSVAVHEDVVYFANSGGLVQGWDLSPLERGGTPTQVLRFWLGDDVDASVIVDDEGMLYAAAEHERSTARSREVGQVVKLDPSRPDDPLVWSFTDPAASPGVVAGVWATPALAGDVLVVPATGGALYGLDTSDGAVRWQLDLPDHLWSSPVVVDGVLLQGDCAGDLHAFDLGPGTPTRRWTVHLGGCVESTPAVWRGRAYVGTRAGQLHAVDTGAPTARM
jgi:outer membrane protein assembly factor BamB